ncbi:MAG: alcohol dehydrogenase catalytic domain-containing protein, partial [Actinomycetota bacterium]
MRAVRIEGPADVRLVEVPVPEPAPGESLVRVGAASACGTDLRMARLGSHAPRVPGHEVAGWLPDGTPVGVHPNLGCGACPACAAGLENRCPDHVDVGIQRDGGLAETVAVPTSHLVPLGDLPVDLAPLVESLACVLHANDLLGVGADTAGVVVGAGSIGVLGAWAMRAVGARVVVVQRSPARRELARSLGIDAIGPQDDPARTLGEAPGA